MVAFDDDIEYYKMTEYILQETQLLVPHEFLLKSSLCLFHEEKLNDKGLPVRVDNSSVHLETVHQVGRPAQIHLIYTLATLVMFI